ncbi:phosphoribosylformylglycinamidine synthase [Ophidiomyces ophidiicola]|nr:phosphoribosylformylglycinamidine synthase [Ophidiomyces ophidiicola]KAI1926533.1 phosphoribosylformylglycinamidine synthase [Ophidiomyces ophidiicola]KAI1931569.1 phosphoribosylformylglycinamidine synthase [Ophidiomyces ophidiicola]KAI1969097.1 phosphoribosylformylglycinamidine synthase [Ophidiomyces ophidiicola]KAI2014905.1 phosphoribosylformylglycinamidine synthase [Ophidiomyces ophidiicola]
MPSTDSPKLVISGSVAFSQSRCRALAASVKAHAIRAQWIHYIDLVEDLQDRHRAVLEQLLLYGDITDEVAAFNSLEGSHVTYYVTPRIGTISPWSSQATGIAHVCGLKQYVKRIERGLKITCVLGQDHTALDSEYLNSLHDRMTQSISLDTPDLHAMFSEHQPLPLEIVSLQDNQKTPAEILTEANKRLGLALDQSEIDYLVEAYSSGGPISRSPTDVELFMFAQVNSEHCRHKQFNAKWVIDGTEKPESLFGMIRNTHKQHPAYTISAYSDNAAVLEGEIASHWAPNPSTGEWSQTKEMVHFLAKVETHNHPTAVSPYPGAATGSGGEIRDEGAVGQGSKPKAGLSGYCVSDLLIPGFRQPWELDIGKPNHIASSFDIMIEAPIGSAAFNNEFGRPCTAGYFRTLLTKVDIENGDSEIRGYHKPIMIAGGVGTVRPQHALKNPRSVKPGSFLVVLGGPAMLIGLGGGAASSIASGEGSADLDFASVQRGNAEVQRRAQEVINSCVSMGQDNPIKFIHDVGAGGLSNALPELIHDAGLGATFELREIDNADKGMSPMQIWCCEAQERYVMAISEDGMTKFAAIARRERCGYSVVGRGLGQPEEQRRLILLDRDSKAHPKPIDLPLSVLFGKPPKLTRTVSSRQLKLPAFDSTLRSYLPEIPTKDLFNEAVLRVLRLPAVGSKSFLITIGDRTVGGLTARDQMVGPWQVPVSDVSVTATALLAGMRTGEAMAMGEKPTLALISPAASARMAVAESLLNIAAADIPDRLRRVKLSANWMSAASHVGEGAALYEAVEAIGMELCPKLGISIPVGKDSMSMKMKWNDQSSGETCEVTAPLSLVISSFAPVSDIRHTWTPALRSFEDVGETILLFVNLSGRKALGGSALAQVFGQVGNECPDIHDIQLFKDFFDATQQLQEAGIVLAYHDRSDGGLFTTLAEMMFAGRCGVQIMLDDICPSTAVNDVLENLFNEELGAVFQVRKKDEGVFRSCFATCGPPPGLIFRIGRVAEKSKQSMAIYHGATLIYRNSRGELQQAWSSTSYHMQKIRDHPAMAEQEYENILDDNDTGLSYDLTFDPKDPAIPLLSSISARFSPFAAKPKVAILREQGVNSQAEMAFAFSMAGFSAIDVHMTDILSGRVSLSSFVGIAACGGFSYGDVLGAGQGWAKSVLLHQNTREEFKAFFERPDTFTLGVCNGCQFLSRLKSLIPGAETWPSFERNESEQYEGRVCMVRIFDADKASPSVFLHGMDGTSLPIAVAHGEGRASFTSVNGVTAEDLSKQNLAPIRYVDNTTLQPTMRYPFNPNGSPEGIAGVRSSDGRVLALMPHPERTIINGVGSWFPGENALSTEWGDIGPWGRVFYSARRWVG